MVLTTMQSNATLATILEFLSPATEEPHQQLQPLQRPSLTATPAESQEECQEATLSSRDLTQDQTSGTTLEFTSFFT